MSEPVTRSSALSARRWSLIAAPTLAGLLMVAGAAADPFHGDGAELYTAYAADPDSLQLKSLGYHFGYLLWAATAFALATRVRGRWAWTANVACVLALLGLTTMPGFVLADFYDSAIGQVFGVEGALQIEGQMREMWALGVLAGTGALGLVLALPVATLSAWRGGLLPWWAFAAPTAAVVIGFFLLGPTVAAGLVVAAGFVPLSVGLSRMPVRTATPVPDDVRPVLS